MKKDELVDALSEESRDGGSGNGEAGRPGDRGPDDGQLRTGDQTSKSLKCSQEATSLDDDPERPGHSLATTSHEVIRAWAEQRGGVPATVPGTEHGDHLASCASTSAATTPICARSAGTSGSTPSTSAS